jgi:hypothetical protein
MKQTAIRSQGRILDVKDGVEPREHARRLSDEHENVVYEVVTYDDAEPVLTTGPVCRVYAKYVNGQDVTMAATVPVSFDGGVLHGKQRAMAEPLPDPYVYEFVRDGRAMRQGYTKAGEQAYRAEGDPESVS